MRRKLSFFYAFFTFFLSVALSGCSSFSPRQNDAEFARFTETLFLQEVSSNAITLHYTLQDPQRYGVTDTPSSLGVFSSDTAGISASLENCLAALHGFLRDQLSPENQLTYDILEHYLQTSLDEVPYTLYEEPLSPLTGTQAQLPILLSEYQFHSPSDVDTYLRLLSDVPEYFDSLIAFEQKKSDCGLFMSKDAADSLIEECDAFLQTGTEHYLYTSFSQRLERLDELTPEQKEAYIQKNNQSIRDCVFPSYQKLRETLSALQETGKNQLGLCGLPDGASYYKCLVKQETGSDRSIEELKQLTHQQITEDLKAMQDAVSSNANPDFSSEASALTPEISDPSSILQELKEKLQDGFPKPPQVNTEIKYVQKEMEEYLSPAFYMVPAIDNTDENVIYINQSSLPDGLGLFTTLAHEGYPGHLYQTVYFASTNPDPIRNILSFGGYTEGWATYSEMLSYYYTSLPKKTATLMQRNTSVLLGLYALADIGIHYDGWTLQDTASFFRPYGLTDTDTVEKIYRLIIGDPANYLKYYIGYVEFLDLKKEAVREWGDGFTQERFHKAVLDVGPAPFSVLRAYTLKTPES